VHIREQRVNLPVGSTDILVGGTQSVYLSQPLLKHPIRLRSWAANTSVWRARPFATISTEEC